MAFQDKGIVRRWKSLSRCGRQFLTGDEGTTTVEWVAIAGVAIIIGVTLTWLTTGGMGSATSYIGSKVNSAATGP
jgi:hypothetical protein